MPAEFDRGYIGSNMKAIASEKDVIEFKNQRFIPNATRGYIHFEMSHAFPNALVYGSAVHPHVISISWETLLHQQLNYEHQIQLYKIEAGETNARNAEDRIIGAVLACDFPPTPGGGWTVNADPTKAPHIEGVASFAKQAKGMGRTIGAHLGGRHEFSVSLEIDYQYSESGFASRLKVAKGAKANGNRPEGFEDPKFDFTPKDMLMAGFEYVPVSKAPEALQATFSKKKGRIVGKWNNRETFLLMGGIDNPVHYAGLGVVKYGAEATAGIHRMAAGNKIYPVQPLSRLAELLSKTLNRVSE